MSTQLEQIRPRRAVLAGALGAIGVIAGRALGAPAATKAANGGSVLIGDASNTGTLATGLTNSASGGDALSLSGTAAGRGLVAKSGTGVGVHGHSGATAPVPSLDGISGVGVLGSTQDELGTGGLGQAPSTVTSNSVGLEGDGDTGVLGSGIFGTVGVTSATGIGVYGSASASAAPPVYGKTGVIGQSDLGGTAIVGFTGAAAPVPPPDTGIYGRSNTGGTNGRGLTGFCASGIGLLGQTNTGVGVRAYSGTNTGMALRVSGKAAFDRSGKLTITAGHSSITLTGIPLTSASFILATLQTNVTGLSIQAAVTNPAGSRFTIYLNKAPSVNVSVAWLAVN
jgi:hypothetical protein